MNKREKFKKPEGSKTHRFLWIGLLIFIALIFACVGFNYRSIRQRLNDVADAAMMETADENAAMLQMTLESRFELMDDVGRKIAEDPKSAQDILTYLASMPTDTASSGCAIWMPRAGRSQRRQKRRFFLPHLFSPQHGRTVQHHGRDQRPIGPGRSRSCDERARARSADRRGDRRGAGGLYAGSVSKDDGCGSFGGEGRGYIVESTGDILVVSSSARIAATGNLLEEMTKISTTGEQDAEQLRQILSGSQSGEKRVFGTGELRLSCRQIENYCENDTWYLIMVMSADALYGKMNAVFSGIHELLGVIVLLCVASVFVTLATYRQYNESLRRVAYSDMLTGGSNFTDFLMKVDSAEGGYMVSSDLDDYKMMVGVFGVQKGDDVLRGVYECISGALKEGEPVARVDADHFVFYLNERQRSVVLERLRQIERGIRRLSDKMGVLHVVPRFGVYAMRPEEDVRPRMRTVQSGAGRGRRQRRQRRRVLSGCGSERVL